MFDYKEIERTIKDNHLPFQEIGDVDKEILIQRLYDTFVIWKSSCIMAEI